ncbi:MAG: efflux RND transporter periplasmic adaptor subunit [Chloroflexota bacterium]
MKKYGKLLIVLVILLVLTIAFFWIQNRKQASSQDGYQTVEAQVGSLKATIGATGTVRANQSAVLSWQTSGTIGDIQVVLGDNVTKGSTLASLLSDSLPQNVILAQADVVNAKRALESLLNSTTAQAQAQLALANAQGAYDDAKWTRQNLETGRNNIDAAANAEAQYIIAVKSLETAQAAYDRLESLADDNPIKAQAYSTLYAAQQVVKSRLNAWNWYKNQANSQDISEADAKLALAEAQLQDAQREWDRLKDGPDPEDIAAAQARVTASQAILKFASILSPFSGTVTEVKSIIGDQVSPGVPGFRIDDLSRLLVDVQVSEVDINGVKMDQPVTLTFDAILDEIYNGKVVSVAQVGNTTQGAVTFTVTVELTDFDSRVKPGMTSAVTIVVNQLNNVLLVPNRAVRLVDNHRVVYILVNGEEKEVEITLGATSGIDSEVLSGDLKEGDLIILNPSLKIGPGSGNGGGMFGG